MTPNMTAIANLPADAPATAVIAAWAGYKVAKGYGEKTDIHQFWSVFDGDEWIDGHVIVSGKVVDPISERNVRRWLLDGLVDIHHRRSAMYPAKPYQCTLIHTPGTLENMVYAEYADTPEAAFAAAVEALANELRKQATK